MTLTSFGREKRRCRLPDCSKTRGVSNGGKAGCHIDHIVKMARNLFANHGRSYRIHLTSLFSGWKQRDRNKHVFYFTNNASTYVQMSGSNLKSDNILYPRIYSLRSNLNVRVQLTRWVNTKETSIQKKNVFCKLCRKATMVYILYIGNHYPDHITSLCCNLRTLHTALSTPETIPCYLYLPEIV